MAIFVIFFPGRQQFAKANAINVEITSSNIPSRLQQSRIPKPIVATSSTNTLGSRTASRIGTASKIPRAISSPNRSCPTTPSVPSSGSRPVTPSFSQSVKTINIFINYKEPDDQE
ncbi:hypothetical protein C1645_732933 [Glomus cerebriforme]|uniref:Uncharacterized protein n=1 Tax=Glomus cerebriforme TaxID=658196 RepID=A0A397TFV4_9GLOM|nr:hypothetical protein C1645_732933 [Glomus cerebriforme]